MDTLVDHDGDNKLLCSDGHLGRSTCLKTIILHDEY